MKENQVELTAKDGHRLEAYEVHPRGVSAGIVIVQEIFGVNYHIRSMVDRYAAMGYHAIAPALFDRVERGVELDYKAETIGVGRSMRERLDWEEAVLDLGAAVAHVSKTGPTAVVGYCYGGSMAWLAAAALPIRAAVGYYGGHIHQFKDRAPQVPTMLHFGELDAAIPLAEVEEVAAEHPDVIVHVYEGADHGFNCDARSSFHPTSAEIAKDRTLDFLRANGVK